MGLLSRFTRRDRVGVALQALRKREYMADTSGHLIDMAAPLRLRAVHALAEHEDERARDGLVFALLDPDGRVRSAAVEALVAAGEGGAAVPHAEALVDDGARDGLSEDDEHALRRLLVVGGHEVESDVALRMLPSLDSPDPARRRRAQQVLAALPEQGIALLVAGLGDPDARENAAATLGELRDQRAVPALIDLLADADPSSRVLAARALGAIRDPQAAEPLMRASTDVDPRVRDAAQEALDRLGMMGVVVGVAQLVQPLIDRVEQLERAVGTAVPDALLEEPDHREETPTE